MRVLIIEENTTRVFQITEHFKAYGHEIACAQDARTGLHLTATQLFDAIILNKSIVDFDAVQLYSRLQREGRATTALIIITTSESLPELLQAFKFGVDDYLCGPFHMAELTARVNVIARRLKRRAVRTLTIHDLVYALDTLSISRVGQLLRLNPISLKTLEVLMRNSPSIVSRGDLEKFIWNSHPPNGDSLRSDIHLLRRTIDRPFSTRLVHNVHRLGYQILYQKGADTGKDFRHTPLASRTLSSQTD